MIDVSVYQYTSAQLNKLTLRKEVISMNNKQLSNELQNKLNVLYPAFNTVVSISKDKLTMNVFLTIGDDDVMHDTVIIPLRTRSLNKLLNYLLEYFVEYNTIYQKVLKVKKACKGYDVAVSVCFPLYWNNKEGVRYFYAMDVVSPYSEVSVYGDTDTTRIPITKARLMRELQLV